MAWDSIATMWKNVLLQNKVRMCDLSVQSTRIYKNRVVCVQYVHTVLMTQFTSRALYAVPRVRIKSEVYFGLKVPINRTGSSAVFAVKLLFLK